LTNAQIETLKEESLEFEARIQRRDGYRRSPSSRSRYERSERSERSPPSRMQENTVQAASHSSRSAYAESYANQAYPRSSAHQQESPYGYTESLEPFEVHQHYVHEIPRPRPPRRSSPPQIPRYQGVEYSYFPRLSDEEARNETYVDLSYDANHKGDPYTVPSPSRMRREISLQDHPSESRLKTPLWEPIEPPSLPIGSQENGSLDELIEPKQLSKKSTRSSRRRAKKSYVPRFVNSFSGEDEERKVTVEPDIVPKVSEAQDNGRRENFNSASSDISDVPSQQSRDLVVQTETVTDIARLLAGSTQTSSTNTPSLELDESVRTHGTANLRTSRIIPMDIDDSETLTAHQNQNTTPNSESTSRALIPFCTLMNIAWAVDVSGSLVLGLCWSFLQNDVSGGFTMSAYVIGVGGVILTPMQFRHFKNCKCSKSEDHEDHA
jgi:hypothetical protein